MNLHRCDVLIIGGGIAGIGLAAYLARDAGVTVLEAESALGYHATGRSAAVFVPGDENPTIRALVTASEPIFAAPDGISDRTLLSPRGRLRLLFADQEPLAGFEVITPLEARELVPILHEGNFTAATYDPHLQDLDVDRLLQGFARKATQHNAQIHKASPIHSITRKTGIWQVDAGGQTYQARILVNAAGAWADEIAQMAKLAPLELQPYRRSAALIKAPEGFDISAWPMFSAAGDGQFYAKPDAGQLMISPADKDPVSPHDAWADDMALAHGMHAFEQVVTIPVKRMEHSWAGLRTISPDATPVVGFDPNVEGFFWLAGQAGDGIHTAPALSCLAANLISGTKPKMPGAVVKALDPGRFRAG